MPQINVDLPLPAQPSRPSASISTARWSSRIRSSIPCWCCCARVRPVVQAAGPAASRQGGIQGIRHRVHLAGCRAPALQPQAAAVSQRERSRGRQIYLATGADERLARRVAAHLGIFAGVLGSDGATNLPEQKSSRLRGLGSGAFDYIGNDTPDLPLLAHAS